MMKKMEVGTQPWLMGGVGIAICTPPIGMGLATLLAPKKYDKGEKEAGKAAIFMGLVGIPKGDYESLFIYRNDLKDRKTIYVARELQEKLAEIVMSMKNREMTIGIYVENIILHHFEVYKDEINRLNELKFKKLL